MWTKSKIWKREYSEWTKRRAPDSASGFDCDCKPDARPAPDTSPCPWSMSADHRFRPCSNLPDVACYWRAEANLTLKWCPAAGLRMMPCYRHKNNAWPDHDRKTSLHLQPVDKKRGIPTQYDETSLKGVSTHPFCRRYVRSIWPWGPIRIFFSLIS